MIHEHQLKSFTLSIVSGASLIMGQILAKINMPKLGDLATVAGIILSCVSIVHFIVLIRKNLRETPKKRKL